MKMKRHMMNLKKPIRNLLKILEAVDQLGSGHYRKTNQIVLLMIK
jgi:hypothetical protein